MSIWEEKCSMPRKKGRTEGGRREGREGREVSTPAGSQRNELVTSLYPIRYKRVLKLQGKKQQSLYTIQLYTV